MSEEAMKQELTACVQKWVDYSHTVFNPNDWICMPKLLFVNKMRNSLSAACASYSEHRITFSLPTYAANRNQEFLDLVVAHEVCHLIANRYHKNHFPFDKLTAHGVIWKDVMRRMGQKPKAKERYNLAENIIRKRPFEYVCGCTTHYLTHNLHQKVQDRLQVGIRRYKCTGCKQYLTFKGVKDFA